MTEILEIIWNYLSSLDWVFILTYILLCSLVTRDGIVSWLPDTLRVPLIKVSKTWRVLLVGIVYAGITYWIRGYTGRAPVENLASSLIFTLVFHKAILQLLYRYIDKKLTPPEI